MFNPYIKGWVKISHAFENKASRGLEYDANTVAIVGSHLKLAIANKISEPGDRYFKSDMAIYILQLVAQGTDTFIWPTTKALCLDNKYKEKEAASMVSPRRFVLWRPSDYSLSFLGVDRVTGAL